MGGYNSATKKAPKSHQSHSTNKNIGSLSIQETVKSNLETIWTSITPKKKFHGTKEDLFNAYLLLSYSKFGIPMDVVRYIIILALRVCLYVKKRISSFQNLYSFVFYFYVILRMADGLNTHSILTQMEFCII